MHCNIYFEIKLFELYLRFEDDKLQRVGSTLTSSQQLFVCAIGWGSNR